MAHDVLSVLIADDDPIQLRHLSALVRRLRPEWDVVSELTSLEQIRNEVDRLNPSLLLLDAQFKTGDELSQYRDNPSSYREILRTTTTAILPAQPCVCKDSRAKLIGLAAIRTSSGCSLLPFDCHLNAPTSNSFTRNICL